jgi:hypothetical protein
MVELKKVSNVDIRFICTCLLTFVSIIRDTRVCGLVSSRERDQARRRGAPTTSNFKLMASLLDVNT